MAGTRLALLIPKVHLRLSNQQKAGHITDNSTLVALTADIVAAYVANNNVRVADLAEVIASTHTALVGLGTPAVAEPAAPEHVGVVSVRKSLASPDHIVSMIDGKLYRMLRRHLTTHGLTEQQYRQRYNLPASYPMVAPAYSAKRSAMAKSIGLGRKAGGEPTSVQGSQNKAAAKPRRRPGKDAPVDAGSEA